VARPNTLPLRLSGHASLLCLAIACGHGSEPTQATAKAPVSAPAGSASASTPSPAASSIAASAPAAPPPRAPDTTISPDGAGVVQGTHGLVTSVEEQATRAGVEVLARGGNAVDAAVAVGFALAVTHPSAGNIGGGGFMLVRLGDQTESIDFRETTPRAMTRPAFDQMIARKARDGAAVGVPGSVKGLYLAHQRHGKLPWRDVVAPAIRLAKEGHTLGKRQALTLGWSWPALKKDPLARAVFGAGKGDAPLARGAKVRQEKLAVALERIAAEGPRGFYEGPTADDLIGSLGEHGLMTREDLASYRAKVRTPLRFSYRGWQVETMPPPSAGGVALAQTMLMLERSRYWESSRGSAQALHVFAEAAQRAQVERRFGVVDPDSISAETLAERQKRWLDAATWLGPYPIDPARATRSEKLHPLYSAAVRELEHTTHFSVVDARGGVVSCTMTLSASFGAKVFTQETGIVLNNAVASFASVGDNTVVGGQRTTSSMAPTLVLDRDTPVLVLGTPGGDTIPNTIAQVFSNLVDRQMSLSAAIDEPRIHHGFVPDEIGYERERPLSPRLVKELKAMGHRVSTRRPAIGDANDIVLWQGKAYGYADPREGGLALAVEPPQAPELRADAPPARPR
jgi:gamma-glutamyltranspeptidase/glutathione hydrolase